VQERLTLAGGGAIAFFSAVLRLALFLGEHLGDAERSPSSSQSPRLAVSSVMNGD